MKLGLHARRFFCLICVLTLIGQLWVPVAHAQAMLTHSGDALATAFCGKVSTTSVQAFRDNAPIELLAKLRSDDAKHKVSPPACELCASTGTDIAAGIPVLAFALMVFDEATLTVRRAWSSPTIRLVRLPPLRAPPLVS